MSGWKEEDFESFWIHYNLCQRWIGISQAAHNIALNDFEWKRAENDVYSMLNDLRPSTAFSNAVNNETDEIDGYQIVDEVGGDNDDEEEDEDEIEISDEMAAFFQKTFEHREERDRQRRLDEERSRHEHGETLGPNRSWLKDEQPDDYVLASEVGIYGIRHKTIEDPADAQQLAELYKIQMAARYGSAADKLTAMELSLNLKFTQQQNKYEPKLWPNIPLRF